ncbi:MAG: hypothetical protein GX801_06635 [Fibrobacter sp.]|nr:hypothetical protein [Fibrobacter sp.]
MLFLFFWGCASNPSPSEDKVKREAVPDSLRLVLLEKTYHRILTFDLNKEPMDSIKVMLTDESLYWIEEIENAALNESRDFVEARPFHEILTIVTFRILERDKKLRGIYSDRLLHLALGHSGLFSKVNSLELGEFEIKVDRGMRGLKISPKVPIIFFEWEDNRWKFDLYNTMPLVLRGVETIGIKKEWEPGYTVIYLLEKLYRRQLNFDIDEEFLEPNR